MARPIKEGLDYYPKDTDNFSDRKIRKLLKEFGSKGYLIFDYLLCVIYRDKGYYVVYDDELAFDVSDQLDNGITEGTVHEVVNGCVRIGLFSKQVFDASKILTSSGIQKRFINIKKTRVIDERIRVIDEKTPVNSEISTQSKVKKSKVNNGLIIPELNLMKNIALPEKIKEKDPLGYQVFEVAIKLYDGFLKAYPNNKDLPLMPVSKWVKPVRSLVQDKGYTYEQIALILNWIIEHKDPFWRTTVIDMETLERNFEKIKIKYHESTR